MDKTCWRANSDKQDDRSRERGRPPVSFQSCVGDSESTHQKAVQVVSELSVGCCEYEAHGDQAEGGQGESNVEQFYVRPVQLKDEITADSKTNQQGLANAET